MDRHFGEIIRILQSFLQGSGKFIATQPKFSKPLPPDDKKINGRLRGFAGLKNRYYGKKKTTTTTNNSEMSSYKN